MSVSRWSRREIARAVIVGIGLFALACAWSSSLRADDYRIGPRDVLEVVVVGETDLTGKYTVRADGSCEFPLVGTVKVAGLTAAEIEARLKQLLADGYLRNPQVSAKVADFESQRIFVAGDVGKPGELPLTGNLTLLEALMKAGGPSTTAGSEIVVLRRSGPAATSASGPLMAGQPGVAEIAKVVLEDLQAGRAKDNVVLKDGDTVFLPPAGVIHVTGFVRNPGTLPYKRGMTVMEVINAAGGVTTEGSRKGAQIERAMNGTIERRKADLTERLQPGDTVDVPKRWW
jgi:polysaccharide export outer membrane protein